jgi:hypothetical protein
MERPAVGGIFAGALIAVVVTVDLLFFRHHVLERLAVNVGIVLAFIALYFRFARR